MDEVDIAPLVMAADIVAAAGLSLGYREKQRVGVILDIEPVADVLATP